MIKKFISTAVICIIVGLSAFRLPASAASYSIYLIGDSTFSDTINLTLAVSGSVNMGGSCGGICGITGVLNYDGAKLELMAASGLQGFDFTQGSTIVLYKSMGASDGGVLSLRFRNKGLNSGESTTVSVNNINVTNGDEEVGLGGTSKTIQYIQPATNSPAPSATSTPTSSGTRSSSRDNKREERKDEHSDEPSADEPSIQEEPAKSSNASLKQLTINPVELDFNKDLLSYDIVVGKDTYEFTIDAEAESDKATIEGLGTFPLSYGLSEYKIVVKAEDGTEKEYVIKVYRDGVNEAISEYESIIQSMGIAIAVLASVIIFTMVTTMVIVIFIKRHKRLSDHEHNRRTD